MAPRKPASVEPSKPKQSRFLIALFLAKSKPSNLSTQEYISSLRSCVQEGRRLDSPRSSHSHINTAEFWRNEFKRSEEAQTELRARIFELEKTLDGREHSRSVTPAEGTSQKKRRRDTNGVEGAQTIVARKRSRTAVDELMPEEDGASLETFVSDMKSLSDHDDAFLQRFYFLQQLMSQSNFKFEKMVMVLCQVSSDIRRIISSVNSSQSSESNTGLGRHNKTTRNQQQKNTQVTSSNQQLDTKLASIARIFPHLLEPLDKANRTAEGRGMQGQVIYSYIEILRDLLTHICVLSASQGSEKVPGACPTVRRNSWPLSSFPPDKTVLKLSNLLLVLISALDTANAAENAILEGFLFFLLTRVGNALKVFVFGSDCEDLPGPSPRIESDAGNLGTDLESAEAQAPYLVYLLKRLIPIAPLKSCQGSRVSSISLTPPPPPTKTSPAAAPQLARATLTKLPATALQSTLLHAVFRSSAKAADFSEALSPPLPTEDLLNADSTENTFGAETVEEGVGDWFKMEVWRIVGWNILSGQIGP
ncbi:hypothetical protein MMC07_005950 [Pseudocyphellaria aurata]|nr:hypothetical protein [Pseudocyphellaria aurata]